MQHRYPSALSFVAVGWRWVEPFVATKVCGVLASIAGVYFGSCCLGDSPKEVALTPEEHAQVLGVAAEFQDAFTRMDADALAEVVALDDEEKQAEMVHAVAFLKRNLDSHRATVRDFWAKVDIQRTWREGDDILASGRISHGVRDKTRVDDLVLLAFGERDGRMMLIRLNAPERELEAKRQPHLKKLAEDLVDAFQARDIPRVAALFVPPPPPDSGAVQKPARPADDKVIPAWLRDALAVQGASLRIGGRQRGLRPRALLEVFAADGTVVRRETLHLAWTETKGKDAEEPERHCLIPSDPANGIPDKW